MNTVSPSFTCLVLMAEGRDAGGGGGGGGGGEVGVSGWVSPWRIFPLFPTMGVEEGVSAEH